MVNYILIDGSYYCFYRYHSLRKWWSNAHKDDPLGEPSQNEIFVDKFKKMYVENINKIAKKLGINKNEDVKILIGKDCPRNNIWRKQLYHEYKSNRDSNGNSDISYFFNLAYNELISDEIKILSHPVLEADDCIAIYSKWILDADPDSKIYIIASDNDYLQLIYNEENNISCNQIEIYNLAFKNLKDQISNKNCNLFCKILMGDVSDNIPPIMSKCGIKTAQKYDTNRELFNQLLDSNEQIKNKYTFNRTLMDFNCIPEQYINEFMLENNIFSNF